MRKGSEGDVRDSYDTVVEAICRENHFVHLVNVSEEQITTIGTIFVE